MYGWVWRKLPGRWPLKTVESLLIVTAVCALLVVVVFPWVEPQLPFSDNTVDGSDPVTPEATPTAPTAPAAPAAPATTDVPAPGGSDTAPGGLAGE